MKRLIKRAFKDLLRKSGRELTYYPLHRYLQDYQIDCVLDVGANVGQYALDIRRYGYGNRILSFEPLTSAYDILRKEAETDNQWDVFQYAFGDNDETLDINISQASSTSSFLSLDDSVSLGNSNIRYIDSESVTVKRLDSAYQSLTESYNNVFLKIDTQGFEYAVLKGAINSLQQLTGVQVEVSLSKIYEGEAPMETIIAFMREQGFSPFWIEQGYRQHASMKLMQVDVYFFRDQSPN